MDEANMNEVRMSEARLDKVRTDEVETSGGHQGGMGDSRGPAAPLLGEGWTIHLHTCKSRSSTGWSSLGGSASSMVQVQVMMKKRERPAMVSSRRVTEQKPVPWLELRPLSSVNHPPDACCCQGRWMATWGFRRMKAKSV